jgi:hypothetical protein
VIPSPYLYCNYTAIHRIRYGVQPYVYMAIYGRKQMVIYGITPYRNCNRKPSLKVLDGYNYGPRITDLYDASVRCTVTSHMDG